MTAKLPQLPIPAGPSTGKGCAQGGGLSPGVSQHLFPSLSQLLLGGSKGCRRLPQSQHSYVSCRDLQTCCSSKASFGFTVSSSSEPESYYTAE